MNSFNKSNLFITIFRIHLLRDRLFRDIEAFGLMYPAEAGYIKGRRLIKQSSISMAIKYGRLDLLKSLMEANLALLIEAAELVRPEHLNDNFGHSNMHPLYIRGIDQFVMQQLNLSISLKQFHIAEYLIDRFPTLKIDQLPHPNLLESGNKQLLFKYLDLYAPFASLTKDTTGFSFQEQGREIHNLLPLAMKFGDLELAKKLVDKYYGAGRGKQYVIKRLFSEMEGHTRFEIFKFYHERGLLEPAQYHHHLRAALESQNYEIVEYIHASNVLQDLGAYNVQCILNMCDLEAIGRLLTSNLHYLKAHFVLESQQLDLVFFLYFHQMLEHKLFVNNALTLNSLLSHPKNIYIIDYLLNNADEFFDTSESLIKWNIGSIHKDLLSIEMLEKLVGPKSKSGHLIEFDYPNILGDAITSNQREVVDYLFGSEEIRGVIKIDYAFALQSALFSGSLEIVQNILTNYASVIRKIPMPEQTSTVDLQVLQEMYNAIAQSGIKIQSTVLCSEHHPTFRVIFKLLHKQGAVFYENEVSSYSTGNILRYAAQTESREWLYFIFSLPLQFNTLGNYIYNFTPSIEMFEILHSEFNLVLPKRSFFSAINSKKNFELARHIIVNYPLDLTKFEIWGAVHSEDEFILEQITEKYYEKLIEFLKEKPVSNVIVARGLVNRGLAPYAHFQFETMLGSASITIAKWLFKYLLDHDIEMSTVLNSSPQFILENNISSGIQYMFNKKYRTFACNRSQAISRLSDVLKLGHINPIAKLVHYLKTNHFA